MGAKSWEIEHQCPQCGGPVTLVETDHLLTCSFCQVRLYLATETTFRYYLPAPTDLSPSDLFYLPYWRFKGVHFSCRDLEVIPSLLDGTFLAFPYPGAPESLGIKPQISPLRFVPIETDSFSRFIEPLSSFDEDFRKIEQRLIRAFGPDGNNKNSINAFIGETVSLVYTPYYQKNGLLYDALLKRPLGQAPVLGPDFPPTGKKKVNWAVRFLPALCPNCGWDLLGDRDSVVFACNNCCSAWGLAGQGLERTNVSIIPASQEPACYLPFWRIRVRSEGLHLQSYADLVRLSTLPKIIQPDWEQGDLYCWLPAFKVHGTLFLRLGKSLSLSPPKELLLENRLSSSPLSPVTLPFTEAVKSLKITFANLVTAKSKIWPLLNDLTFQADHIRLVYLPFHEQGEELIEMQLNISIMKNALRHGINL